MAIDGLLQLISILLDVVALRANWFVSRSEKIPVGNAGERSISLQFERVSRHQLADIAIKRLLPRQVTEGKILWKSRTLELSAEKWGATDHLDIRHGKQRT